MLAERYVGGATVYELAKEFGIDRRTVAIRLKAQGVKRRNQPATPDEITQIIELYASGLSLVRVAKKTRFSAKTLRNYLRAEGIQLRDTHGRESAINSA